MTKKAPFQDVLVDVSLKFSLFSFFPFQFFFPPPLSPSRMLCWQTSSQFPFLEFLLPRGPRHNSRALKSSIALPSIRYSPARLRSMQAVCSADQSVLACAYCGHFPVDVVETQCSQSCSPLYCWECVVRLDKCVSCAKRIEVERLRPLPFIRQRLSMINVRCEHPGCSAIFKSGERDKHERACPFVQIACSINPSCGTFNR